MGIHIGKESTFVIMCLNTEKVTISNCVAQHEHCAFDNRKHIDVSCWKCLEYLANEAKISVKKMEGKYVE